MSKNYLENNICKFTPINFKIDYTHKKNMIVTSLFKMNVFQRKT